MNSLRDLGNLLHTAENPTEENRNGRVADKTRGPEIKESG